MNITTMVMGKKALTWVRRMARAKFTQSDIDRISKAAAKSDVSIVVEFIAPGGGRVNITARKAGASGDGEGSELDKWLRDHDARSAEGR